MSRATRRRVSDRRPLLVGLSSFALLAGAGAAALGWHVQSSPEDRTPVPLAVGEPVTVGERAPFVGDLVVYGVTDGERPDLDSLACQVTAGGGPLSTDAAAEEDRIVVDGVGLVPLVSFPGGEGHSIVCSGGAAAAAAPLYLVPGATSRSLVPLGAYSVAALGLPLGAAGLLMLRASRD